RLHPGAPRRRGRVHAGRARRAQRAQGIGRDVRAVRAVMRVLPAALALSVVGHGAAIAWIATRPHRPPLPRVAPHVGTPPPRVREPIAVTVLGDAVAPSRGRGRIAVAPAMPRVEVAAPPPRPIEVAVSNTFVEQFLAKPPQ